MVIDIFSISAILSKLERIFSGAKNTFSDNKVSLTMYIIQAIQSLKSWFCSKLFTKRDFSKTIHANINM